MIIIDASLLVFISSFNKMANAICNALINPIEIRLLLFHHDSFKANAVSSFIRIFDTGTMHSDAADTIRDTILEWQFLMIKSLLMLSAKNPINK